MANISRSFLFCVTILLASCSENTGNRTDLDKTEKLEEKRTDTETHEIYKETVKEPRESIDTIREDLKKFIPQDYSVINVAYGDLNGDNLDDAIIVLKRNGEEKIDSVSPKRPMLVLLKNSDNSYRQFLRSDEAILKIDDGGVFDDPFIQVTIENGGFIIEHGVAGGHHWEETHKFEYSPQEDNWFLVDNHYKSYRMNESDDPDAEALVVNDEKHFTVKDFGKIALKDFSIYSTYE